MKVPDIETYLSSWKKRARTEEEKRLKRAKEALRVALAIAQTLVEKGKAKRVYLFGSLASSMRGWGRFDFASDIDLAAEAIPKGEYFRILAEVNRMSDFEVDLVDLEACPAHIFELISQDINGSRNPKSLDWHKRLLFRMSIAIPEVRPAVISEELRRRLEEYLRFGTLSGTSTGTF